MPESILEPVLRPIDTVHSRQARVIGVACGSGARDHGCADGPDVLHKLGFLSDLEERDDRFRWIKTIHLAQSEHDPLSTVRKISEILAHSTSQLLAEGDFPIVIGGDHSCAIGTWSGVRNHLGAEGRLGLLWIDAHMDSHTFKTSPSRAIHGMPLACLLGHGDAHLTHLMSGGPVLLPQDVCLIGVRSFEDGEAALLSKLGVRVYFMNEVKSRGLAEVFREAIAHVSMQTTGYGISLDLDALDPAEEAGVGSPAPDGLHRAELVTALASIGSDKRLLAFEIVEYNPYRDEHYEAARALRDLCQSLLY